MMPSGLKNSMNPSKKSDYKKTILELFKQTSFPRNPANCAHDLFDNKKIIFFGAGGGGITFLIRVLRQYGFKAHAVLDRKFKSGDVYFGIPAFSPLEYKPTNEEKENAVAVITVVRPEYHEEASNCLRSLGFKNVISAFDIYEYNLAIPTEVEKRGFDFYLDSKEQIMACPDLFSDDLSREIFTCFIQTHMTRKPIHIPSSAIEEQYFPRDIALSKGYSRFVNCGAYNGDTVMRLNALFGKVDAIACFEPDAENFELLNDYLSAKHDKIARSVIAFPCGVFSSETQLHFTSGNKGVCTISDKGDFLIQCVALDHVIPGFKPTFIDMDVEGAELEALKGAETLIRENKPDLAISVYHAPNHIWDIPLYVESLHLGYRFYLRNYSSFTDDTVLYATT